MGYNTYIAGVKYKMVQYMPMPFYTNLNLLSKDDLIRFCWVDSVKGTLHLDIANTTEGKTYTIIIKPKETYKFIEVKTPKKKFFYENLGDYFFEVDLKKIKKNSTKFDNFEIKNIYTINDKQYIEFKNFNKDLAKRILENSGNIKTGKGTNINFSIFGITAPPKKIQKILKILENYTINP